MHAGQHSGAWAYISTPRNVNSFSTAQPPPSPPFATYMITSKENATLLGALLTVGPTLNDALEARCADLGRAIRRLSLLPAQGVLTLLKSSFSAPNILHMLCCSPCHGHEALDKFDYLLRTELGSITKLSISDI